MGKPSYRIDYDCPDPNSGGSIRFVNTSTTAVAELYGRVGHSVSTATVGTGGGVTLPTLTTGTGAEFQAAWYDGHHVTLWVFTHHGADFCYVDLRAVYG